MSDTTNGHANGAVKGGKGKVINGIKGQTAPISRRRTPTEKARPGFLVRILSIATRLAVWYSILTVLFRCPSSLDACTETSPAICRPYFQVKQAVSPHLAPYYDAYAAPYVEMARPYYETVDRIVITPTRTYAVKYGGPRLVQAQALASAQWEKNVQPQISKYQTVAKAQYDQYVAPHVQKASSTVAPYYAIATTNALQTYHEFLLPSYLFVQPYALQGYNTAYVFTTDTAIPATQWTWNKTYSFLDSTVWPHLRDVYVMKVEPQLLRIGARLGRYKDKKPKASVVDGAESPAAKSTFSKPASSSSSTGSTPTSTAAVVSTPMSVAVTPKTETKTTATGGNAAEETNAEINVKANEAPKNREEVQAAAAKIVAEDLEMWQNKFTKAYEEAADEIEERVAEVSRVIIRDQANVTGRALVVELDQTVQTELAALKKTIIGILKKHQDDEGKSKDALSQEVADAVRVAGLEIRDKAQAIRTWRQEYEQSIEQIVTEIAAEHIKILEAIRDLALQKTGMKWAWMDGITYKDWQKYHQLRDRLDEWTDDMKVLVTSHPALPVAQAAGTEIEDEGMAIAGEAAAELGLLKQVAVWKAIAADFDNNDWDPASTEKKAEEAVAARAAAAQKKAEDEAAAREEAAQKVIAAEKVATAEAQGETVTVSLASASTKISDEARQAETSVIAEPEEPVVAAAKDEL